MKSLVFVCDGEYALALVPGDRRADAQKVAAAAGATEARVARADGGARGDGVRAGRGRALPARRSTAVVMERTLLQHGAVWIGAGLAGAHGARSAPADLAAASPARERPISSSGGKVCGSHRQEANVQATEKIWMNGELVDWDDARVHVGAHGLHYGTGVFEGIRCYDTPEGPAVFRAHRPHAAPARLGAADRHGDPVLGRGAARRDERAASAATASASATSGRSRSTASASSASSARGNPVDTAIMTWPWGTYLGDEALTNGIRAKISSWQRVPPNVIPHASKATGVYLNSMLAVTEAQNAGYDEAIMLTPEGTVADGPGETIFIVKGGTIYTPDLSTGILHGITRDSVIQIAADLGTPCSRRR